MLPNTYKSRLGGLCFTYMCRPARDGMVVGFKTNFAITTNVVEFASRSW